MGCCCSAHAEAAETELPPPLFGKDIKVKVKKNGWFSADFNVFDCQGPGGEEKPDKWMLIDAVGDMNDSAYDYFLKYRPKGAEKSEVLGCVNLKKEHDYMWWNVTYAHQRSGRHRSTMSKRRRMWTDKVVKATWTIARRCRMYQDLEQTQLVGRLQISGSGTYERHYHLETWRQRETYTVKQGDRTVRKTRWVNKRRVTDKSNTNLTNFHYDMKAYGTDFNIMYNEQASGSWFKADEYTFHASNPQGMPLFRVVSDGSKNATIETFCQSDPVNSILAAFAVSVKMEPKEFDKQCKTYCKKHISLDSMGGGVYGFGKNDVEYEAEFPTPGEWAQPPPMGFSYGLVLEALPIAVPMAQPVGQPFTPMATPVFEAIPMAEPIAMPAIPVGTVLPVGDGAMAIAEPEEGGESGGELTDGDDDDDGAGEDGGDDNEVRA